MFPIGWHPATFIGCECSNCEHWIPDTEQQSEEANDPPGHWGTCSVFEFQTEFDFLCRRYEQKYEK